MRKKKKGTTRNDKINETAHHHDHGCCPSAHSKPTQVENQFSKKKEEPEKIKLTLE